MEPAEGLRSEDNWNTAGFPEDNTTTVVGDTKETPAISQVLRGLPHTHIFFCRVAEGFPL